MASNQAATRHALILDYIARLLRVGSRGNLNHAEDHLPAALIEPAIALMLSVYPDCPGGADVDQAMAERPAIDRDLARKFAMRWTGWCELLHTGVPMEALSVHPAALKASSSPSLRELVDQIDSS